MNEREILEEQIRSKLTIGGGRPFHYTDDEWAAELVTRARLRRRAILKPARIVSITVEDA
jgi:hypothetical protein